MTLSSTPPPPLGVWTWLFLNSSHWLAGCRGSTHGQDGGRRQDRTGRSSSCRRCHMKRRGSPLQIVWAIWDVAIAPETVETLLCGLVTPQDSSRRTEAWRIWDAAAWRQSKVWMRLFVLLVSSQESVWMWPRWRHQKHGRRWWIQCQGQLETGGAGWWQKRIRSI